MKTKRQLYYMFALQADPDVKIIKTGTDELAQYMTDYRWKCVGYIELTNEQFDLLNYFFE